jgi:hypothetical protein
MLRNLKAKHYLFFAGGLFVSIIVTGKYFFKLEPTLTLEILQLCTILFALVTFLYTKRKDFSTEVSKQIAFYSEKVIPLQGEFMKVLLQTEIVFVRVELIDDTFESLCNDPKKIPC